MLLLSSLAAREPHLSHYARSKRAGEAVLEGMDDLQWCAYRAPAVYGPGDKELRPTLDGMRRGLAAVPGHSGRFSLIYVDDLVDAMLRWLDSPPASGSVFELDDGTHHDHIVCQECGRVEEFLDPMIESRQEEITLEHGFEIISHSMILYGRCVKVDCASRKRSS